MSSSAEIERLQAEASYCRDRVSLMRAKLSRLGLGPSARLRELERELERATALRTGPPPPPLLSGLSGVLLGSGAGDPRAGRALDSRRVLTCGS